MAEVNQKKQEGKVMRFLFNGIGKKKRKKKSNNSNANDAKVKKTKNSETFLKNLMGL